MKQVTKTIPYGVSLCAIICLIYQTSNGEGEGSVKKQVNDAVAKIIADAPEAYDTLKEISD